MGDVNRDRRTLDVRAEYDHVKVSVSSLDYSDIPHWEATIPWADLKRPDKPKRPIAEIEHDLACAINSWIGNGSHYDRVERLRIEWLEA